THSGGRSGSWKQAAVRKQVYQATIRGKADRLLFIGVDLLAYRPASSPAPVSGPDRDLVVRSPGVIHTRMRDSPRTRDYGRPQFARPYLVECRVVPISHD